MNEFILKYWHSLSTLFNHSDNNMVSMLKPSDEGSPETQSGRMMFDDFCWNPSQQHQQQQQQPDLLESAYLTFLAASQRKTQFGIN